VERRAETLATTASARLALEKSVVPVQGTASFPLGRMGGTAALRFDTLEPAAAAALVPEGLRALLATVEVPLTGSVKAERGPGLVPYRVRLEAEGGAGAISSAALPDAKVPVRGVRLTAVLDVPADRVTVESIVNLDRARLRSEGEVADVHAERRL